MKQKSGSYLTSCFEKTPFFLAVLFIIVCVAFSLYKPSVFLNFRNLSSIAFQFSELGLFAIAMCLAIIPGGIDLSVVSMANLSAVFMALFFEIFSSVLPPGLLIPLAIALGLAVGLACGSINGFLIGYFEIPAMLATLVTMTLFMGLGIGITGGATVAGVPENFLWLGIGFVGGIPVPLIIFSTIALVIYLLLMKHRFGWSLFLIGTNVKASALAGVNNRQVLMYTHILIGLIASIAGVVILARTNSASSSYGNSYTLSSILIVILGGVNILGGRGYFAGVVLAVIFLQVLSTGFNMLLQGVSGGNFFKDFVWGFLLLAMIFVNKNFSAWTERWKSGRFFKK